MEQKHLKSGYTTGTCAAAAAKAAAVFLLTGRCPETVKVRLPSGKAVCLETKEVRLPSGEEDSAETVECDGKTGEGSCEQRECREVSEHVFAARTRAAGVKKDAGDDPDVTHGAWICGIVSEIDANQLEDLKRSGAGYWLEEYPQFYLSGGTGIGMVTKPGLSCPTGHYAINPVPRQMILAAVEEAVKEAAFEGCLFVQIAIPDGVRLAEKTFNPRLGIMGGISVLGTTGIVKPMSEEALVATIRLDIHMKAADGQRILLMAPGNYGESFLQEQMGVSLGKAVLCSNFVRDAAVMLAEEGVEQALFVSHIGKLVKVSAGIENTHSRYGDGRMEQMERLMREVWLKSKEFWLDETPGRKTDGLLKLQEVQEFKELQELQRAVRGCNTTDEVIGILLEYQLAEPVLAMAAEWAKKWMETWADGKTEVQVVTFSSAYGILGKTKGADALFQYWKESI